MHWAFAIARSAFLDRRRYWRRRPEQLGSTDDVAEDVGLHADERYAPESQIRTRDLLEIMGSELAKMSEKNRSAYVLLKEEGLSAKDAAAVLGTTAQAVKQRAHRAYEQLRMAVGTAGWREHVDQSELGSNRLRYGAARGALFADTRFPEQDPCLED
jgi:RNA polymerase sigma-70 factor (ECF subfamily)